MKSLIRCLLIVAGMSVFAAAQTQIDLATQVRGTLPAANMPALTGACTTSTGSVNVTCGSTIAKTGAGTDLSASSQVTSLHVPATTAGTIIYFNGSVWTTLAGNTSGTLCLQETSSGVPSWQPCGGVTSVFGRTGIVTAQSGDYTVSQITGAAPTASPTFSGSVTLPVFGSTQCLHVNSSGVVSGAGTDCSTTAGVVLINPTTSQKIVQPPGTQTSTNNFSNTRYVTSSYNWVQNSVGTSLTAGVQATITLPAGIVGVDTSGSATLGGPFGGYQVYISGDANPEAVYISGGTYTYASGGTIIFTPFFSHTSGAYNVGSASGGIQEAINDGCGATPISSSPPFNATCKIIIPPAGPATNPSINGINVYGTIYFHAYEGVLSGYGAVLNCYGRGVCLQIGNLTNSNNFVGTTIEGISFRAPIASVNSAYTGNLISNTQRTSGTITITTAAAHNFRTGDMVSIMYTDHSAYWGDVPSITVTGSTTFTYSRSGVSDIASTAEPGLVALTYVPILDNATGTHFKDIQYEDFSESGQPFSQFFDFWDDENATIDNYESNAHIVAQSNKWLGYTIYSGGASNLPNHSQQLAPFITVRNSSLTNSPCVYDTNSNGLFIEKSICQNSVLQARVSTVNGNFQGASFTDMYSETAASANGAGTSPWGGLGVAGLLGGPTSGTYVYHGNQTFSGALPTVGTGATAYLYVVIAHDTTAGAYSIPLPAMFVQQSVAGSVTVSWPRITNEGDTIVYDLLRLPSPSGSTLSGITGIYTSLCVGGATNICGSVVTSQAQGSGFIQTFTDDTSVNTTAYTVNTASFTPNLAFWPGPAIMTGAPLIDDYPVGIITGAALVGSETSILCGLNGGTTVFGGVSHCTSTSGSNSGHQSQTATFLNDGPATGGGMTLNSKGRLNFRTTTGISGIPHHIITLVDSAPDKTGATQGYRPVADPNDVWIGLDGASGGFTYLTSSQLAMGSPVAISEYIGNVGDNTSYKERLTSTTKTFNVPVVITSGNTLTLGGITGSTQCLHVNTSGVISGTGSDCPTGAGTGNVVVSGTPTLNQIAQWTDATHIQGLATTGTGSAVLATSPTISTGLTLGFVTGSTQCLQVNSSGVVSGTGATCGGTGATPGGATNSIQYNAGGGAFGGTTGLSTDAVGNLTIAQGTITTSTPFVSHTVTWNAGAVVFTNYKSSITCTAAALGSIGAGWGVSGTDLQLRYNSANCGSPQLLVPAGSVSSPALSSVGNTTTGIVLTSSIGFSVSGAYSQILTSTGSKLGTGGVYGFSSNANPAAANNDTGLSRDSAGVMDLGNGTVGDKTGSLQLSGLTASGTVTFSGISGSTQCLQVNSSGIVSGTGATCGGGGSSAWSSLTNPSTGLSLSMSTNQTTFTYGDLGVSPVTGLFTITDSASTTTDTSTNLLLNTGVSSRHNPLAVQVAGTNQLQVCWQSGPLGEIVFGSSVACSAINQSPFAKVVIQSSTAQHNNLRLYQASTTATGTMLESNNATAAGTGFYFAKFNTGCTGADTGCSGGVTTAFIRGDGLVSGTGLQLNGSTSGSTTLSVTATGGTLSLGSANNQINSSGTTVTDSGLTTAGLGHPVQTGAVNLTAQTASITNTTVVTVGGTTTNYDVKAGVQCTASSSAATIQLTITYTDTSNTSQTLTFPVQPNCTTLGAASVAYIGQPIRAKNGTTIQYSTTITNTPTYDVFVDLYQLN